jgi:glycosyltransferase involved in cell wall biosynthesis
MVIGLINVNHVNNAIRKMPATTHSSTSHLVLIPSYNPGDKVLQTVTEARQFWNPVWVVVDGSTDGSDQKLVAMSQVDPGLRVLVLAENQGKGGAVLHGAQIAAQAGFTHLLAMDSDGQHPAQLIPQFMAESSKNSRALILGKPVFDANAPKIRVNGRKISNWWANLETLWQGIGDSLYGFRVYPIAPLVEEMSKTRWMRRFDFDVELVVRLCWAGLKPVNIDAPVKYFSSEEGGVSHFKYGRDNVLLTGMHIRLFVAFLFRLPILAYRKVFRR